MEVSREVTEALNDRLAYDKPSEIIKISARNGWEERGVGNYGFLNCRHLDLDTLIKALYVGYEIGKTPEERIFEYYQDAQWVQMKDAIIFVLETLDVQIKGVNE